MIKKPTSTVFGSVSVFFRKKQYLVESVQELFYQPGVKMCVFLHLWGLSVILYLFISQSDSNYNLLLGNLAIEVGKYSVEGVITYQGIIRRVDMPLGGGRGEQHKQDIFHFTF